MNAVAPISQFPLIGIAIFVFSWAFFYYVLPTLPGTARNEGLLPASLVFSTLHVMGVSTVAPCMVAATIYGAFWAGLGSAMSGHAFNFQNFIAWGFGILFLTLFVMTLVETIVLSKIFGNALKFSKKSYMLLSIATFLIVEIGGVGLMILLAFKSL